MASITIRNLDRNVKERLRLQAARHGHSMEEEVRLILRRATSGMSGSDLLRLSDTLFGPQHGADLELPSRDDNRPTPQFD